MSPILFRVYAGGLRQPIMKPKLRPPTRAHASVRVCVCVCISTFACLYAYGFVCMCVVHVCLCLVERSRMAFRVFAGYTPTTFQTPPPKLETPAAPPPLTASLDISLNI